MHVDYSSDIAHCEECVLFIYFCLLFLFINILGLNQCNCLSIRSISTAAFLRPVTAEVANIVTILWLLMFVNAFLNPPTIFHSRTTIYKALLLQFMDLVVLRFMPLRHGGMSSVMVSLWVATARLRAVPHILGVCMCRRSHCNALYVFHHFTSFSVSLTILSIINSPACPQSNCPCAHTVHLFRG